ncbi:MAG: DUF1573 domain-containing protein [Cytophagales bacterium]|nr:DUF1573 domain-containing protein [Cytophagales bacterium]
MRAFALILLVLFPCLLWSQAVEPLIFREKTHDFGDILESNGNADHEFVFTNSSARPMTILSVNASCGCTTPGWSKQPVPSGKTGFIKASFDPRGRPGYFNKSLTILTDLDPNPIVLQIKGQVLTGEPLEADDFPVAVGKLLLQSKSFNMGTVFINRQPTEKKFPVMNGGTTPMRFLAVAKPDYVLVETPAVLKPREKGVIRIVFDGRAYGKFGFASDNLLIVTDDPEGDKKFISLYTTLQEYYPIPSLEEQAFAPQAILREQVVDLGQYRAGASIERDVRLVNKGKKELQIKALMGNCTCISAESKQKAIRPGDSTQIHISFKPQNREGTQQKAITVYTNDPWNPVQRISVQVYIDN